MRTVSSNRDVCYVTTTPPPVSGERRSEMEVVRGTQGNLEMKEAVFGGSGMTPAETEEDSMITPRESGIARAVIASERRSHPAEGWVETEIQGKRFKLGGSLNDDTRRQIVEVIESHLDAFAWSASNMPGIDPDFLCHRLTMDPHVRPVR